MTATTPAVVTATGGTGGGTGPGDGDGLLEMFNSIQTEVADAMRSIDWAEEEIEAAANEHPDSADLIYHAFLLTRDTHPLMKSEFVYRAHVREILARVAAGQDTRPGTAVEVALVCSKSSELAPLTSSGTTLYLRMWRQAFGEEWLAKIGDGVAEELDRAEASWIKTEVDNHERLIRNRIAKATPWRRLDAKTIDCPGRHHGDPAPDCRFAPELALEGMPGPSRRKTSPAAGAPARPTPARPPEMPADTLF